MNVSRIIAVLTPVWILAFGIAAYGQEPGTIGTYAGGGDVDRDTLATQARLDTPVSLAVDGQGDLFLADFGAHRVRRVDARTGVLTTVAGTGDFGFDGDNGPAAQAKLYRPSGVAVDGQGNLYIADRGNRRIRRVDAKTGIITTVAGTGQAGFSGDGGAATQARLYEVVGLAMDAAGGLLIVDGGAIAVDALGGQRVVGNHRIRRLDPATGLISTVAGNGNPDFFGDGGPATAAGLSFPAAVFAEGSGRILIADAGNHRVRAVDPATGKISTLAGTGGDPFTGQGSFSGDGGAALSAGLNAPAGLAADPSGNLYVADQGNQRVRRIDAGTGVIVTVAGTGDPTFGGDGGRGILARINLPAGLGLLPSGTLLIADSGNGRIRQLHSPSALLPYGEAPGEVTFGSLTVGTSRSLGVAVRNRGNAPLRVLGIRSDSPAYAVRDTSLTVSPADSAVFAVTFSPLGAGRADGRLTISIDDPGGALTVLLRGQGVVPNLDMPESRIDFGPVVIGRPDTLSLTVYNLGAGQLLVRSVISADSQFLPIDVSFSVISGQSRPLRIAYSPRTVGESQATLTIQSNDPDEGSFVLSVRGIGRASRPGGFRAIGDSTGLGGSGREFGVAWGDYNGDGKPDLYVVRSGGRASSLYRNDGDGAFTDVAAQMGVTNDRDGSAAVWGDFDNDGDLDLFVTNFNQPSRLYRNDPGGKLVDVAAEVGLGAVGAGMGAAWADYDNDGRLDLFVASFGPNRLYHNEGGRFADVAASFGLVDSLGSSVQPVWGDYNGDGRIDLYVAASGKSSLYRNDGARFADVGDSLKVAANAPAFGAAWADFDNDGDLDLFVTGFNSPCHLYRNNGNGTFTDVEGQYLLEDDGKWKARGVVWADIDNDGDLDLLIIRSGQPNLFYRNDGARFVEAAASMGLGLTADGRGAAAADFDGDGAADLYVTNQDRPGRLLQNQQAEGGWVAVQLVGTRSTTDAIGARVRLAAGGRTLLQEVSGGSSHLSQSGTTLSFGIGKAERADTLTVRWPSGIVQVFTGLPEGRLVRIVETAPNPPIRIALSTSAPRLIANGTSTARITATVLDGSDERALSSRAEITFRLVSGQGVLVGPAIVGAQDGVATILFRSPAMTPGQAIISARSEGLSDGQVPIDLLPPSPAGILSTVAGSGLDGRSGDGGAATQAAFSGPEGVSVADTAGTLYIADTNNSVIRRVDGLTKVVSTVAGTGVRGSLGDGGPALLAGLNTPSDVLVGPDGRLWIVDTGNHKVRRVDPRTGVISTVAGTGILGSGGDGGPGPEAGLFFPGSAALDRQGNLFIADTNNHRIRRVDATTGTITTLAGDGIGRYAGDGAKAFRASLNRPGGVAADSTGNLFIADTNNHRIRRVDAVTGIITTVAGNGQPGYDGEGGPALYASLNLPRRIAVEVSGSLVLVDTGNQRIRVVDGRTGLITTAAGTGNGGFNGREGQDAARIDLNGPVGISRLLPGVVVLADVRNHLIRSLKLGIPEAPGPPAGADFNGDGAVELADFFMFVEHFGTKEGGSSWDSGYDLAKDGVIDFNDFFAFAEQFGRRLSRPTFFSP